MNRINVLHIYQNSKVGGIQRQIFNVLASYDKEVFNPIFCSLGPRKETGAEIEKLGIEFVPLDRAKYHKLSPAIIFDLYRLMRKKRIHIVRTHKYRSNFYGRIAAWLAGVPVIIASEHNIYIDKELRLSRRLINRLLAGVTDKMIAVSDAIRRDIIRYDRVDPSKVMVIRNGVDTDKFRPGASPVSMRENFSFGKEDIVLGFIGRLVPQKGLVFLLEAFASLCAEFGRLRLLVVGDGDLMNEMRSKAETLNIFDRVTFLGERRDIPDLLACIDIYVMSSIKEGLPNALLEAMSSGKPVVATEAGGIPEVIRHGSSGLLAPPGNAAALAEAIKLLINDPLMTKQLGLTAREVVEENFSMKATARKWQALYLDVLCDKGLYDTTKGT